MTHIDLPPHIARPSAALVGPIAYFRGQPVAVNGSPPRDTTDPRYGRCTDHRLACDCREAELSEQITENRFARNELRDHLEAAIVDHPTRVILDGYPRPDLDCRCQGCVFARALELVPYPNIRYVESRA